VTYRYDWRKHSKGDMLEFYLNELPKLGWTRTQYPSLDDVRESRQASFAYKGNEGWHSLSLQVTDSATMVVQVW
jgi:hypothetical protein